MKLWIILAVLFIVISPCAAQGQSWCGLHTEYFQHNESTSPAGYEELINYPSGNPQVDENVTITVTSGPTLIDSYITPDGAFENTNALLKGLRRYRVYSYVSSNVGTTTLNFSAYKRNASGYETFYYSAISDDINDLVATEYLISYAVVTDLHLDPTDRFVIKVYAQTTHSSPITVHWVYQGTTNTSHVESGYFVCEEEITQPIIESKRLTALPLPIWIVFAAIAVTFVIVRKKD